MSIRILGIESSCDETAAAVVADGREVLSSIVASQVEIHRKYGGVVPELASREHLRRIVPVVREALGVAGMGLDDLDAIGATRGPGLIGALLVGFTYAQALAMALRKPLVAVNHLEGHVHAVFLEAYRQGLSPALPAICLIVSGGHTVIYGVAAAKGNGQRDQGVSKDIAAAVPEGVRLEYTRIGASRDDAAGEAYDKVARMLALGYPGGPVIDLLAPGGNPEALRFTTPNIRGNPLDFSFSGIKSAVLRHIRQHSEMESEIAARQEALDAGRRKVEDLRPLVSSATLDLLASFQRSVVTDLVTRTLAAADDRFAASVMVSGGVAANRELRDTFEREGKKRGLDVFFPSRALCTDNAAMIAAAAYPRLLDGEVASGGIDATANLPLA